MVRNSSLEALNGVLKEQTEKLSLADSLSVLAKVDEWTTPAATGPQFAAFDVLGRTRDT
jgi:hypothetical protein